MKEVEGEFARKLREERDERIKLIRSAEQRRKDLLAEYEAEQFVNPSRAKEILEILHRETLDVEGSQKQLRDSRREALLRWGGKEKSVLPKAPAFRVKTLTPGEMVEQYKAKLEEEGIPWKAAESDEAWLSKAYKSSTPSEPTQLRLLLTRQRNAVMVSEQGAEQAKQWRLGVVRTPQGSFTVPSLAAKKAFIAYRPGESRNAKEIIRVLQKYPVGRRGVDYIREMGKAEGTPSSETEAYISSLEKKMEKGEIRKPSFGWSEFLVFSGVLLLGSFLLRRAAPIQSGVVSLPTQYQRLT